MINKLTKLWSNVIISLKIEISQTYNDEFTQATEDDIFTNMHGMTEHFQRLLSIY